LGVFTVPCCFFGVGGLLGSVFRVLCWLGVVFWYAFVVFLTWMGSVPSGLGVPFGGWGVLLALMRDPPSPPL
jgi:hypothetical protein